MRTPIGCLFLTLFSAVQLRLLAQTPPPPSPQVTVVPPDQSIMVTETTNTVFVTVDNLNLFTNVVVVGSFAAQQNIPFLDDGLSPDLTAMDGTFTADLITPRVRLVAANVPLSLVITAEVLPPPDVPPDPTQPPVMVASTNVVTYLIVPRPANDNFADAFKITTETAIIYATNNYASMEPGEPRHAQVSTADASVWWTWSTVVSTNVLVDLAGSSFEPILAVYTGTTVSNLTPVASSPQDVVNGLKAHVNFDTTPGLTYRIAVAGANARGVGDIRLRVAPGARPDTNGPLVTIIAPATESLFTNATIRLTGTAKDVQPNGTGIDSVFLRVNNGPLVGASGTAVWAGTVILPPGTNFVRAFAQDIAGNRGPVDTIVLRFINPTNDDFAAAIDLPDIAGTIVAVNERASRESGEPLHAGNEGGHSIWYRFRAPVNGTLFLSTSISDFDTLLDVFVGDSVTALTAVAGNDDAFRDSEYSELTCPIIANQTYSISVDGYGGTYGNIQLQYVFTTTDRYYSLTVNQPLGGGVAPPSGLYLSGTTLYVTAAPARDFEFIGWDGEVVSTDNPLTVVMNQNHNLEAKFRIKSYTEGFESGGLRTMPWSTTPAAPWTVQSSVVDRGRFAARSGFVGDTQSSSLILVTGLLSGTGSFDVRVSSEAGWDTLEFYLNGVRLQRWSGDVAWQNFLFRVPAGLCALEWRYSKDANFSDGLDAAFIDNLYLPLPDSSIAARLSLLALPDGRNQIQVQGLSGRLYVIESATNLAGWISVSTNSSPDGIIQWTDSQRADQPRQFYRAVAP